MHQPGNPFRARRGFFLTDILVGLIIVVVLMTALATMVWRQNLAGHKLADTRAALRLAEKVVADLHAGAPVQPVSGVRVRLLSDGPVAGKEWVEVRATVDGRSASLVALVDAGRVKQEATP